MPLDKIFNDDILVTKKFLSKDKLDDFEFLEDKGGQ